jgi:hypothetical protein
MEYKLNLRKLSAVNKELQGVIRVNKRKAKDLAKVTLRAHQVEDKKTTYDNAIQERTVLLNNTSALQNILSRFRAVVACKNNEFGVTATLQELRETEDRLSIVSDFLVEPSKGNPDYDGYGSFEDAVSQIQLYEKELESAEARRRVGKSEAQVRLVSSDELVAEHKALLRKVKEIKNDRLVALNFKEVSVSLTEQEKEMLVDLNIL